VRKLSQSKISEQMTSPLSGKTVLVTGGRGFLGSFVVDKLHQRGAAEVVAPGSAEYDLVDRAAVRALMGSRRFDLVVHLAARCGGIGANQDEPGRFFFENLMMGAQLVEEARLAGVPKLVLTGTICAYPKSAPVPFHEDDLWSGYPEETNAPYGLAKKMLLVQAQAYRQQYGTNAVVIFPVNLYGPRDNFDFRTSHVIPALIRKIDAAMRDGKGVVTLWGDGSPTREFLYVEDCAEGLVLAAERYDGFDPVNLGTGFEISIRDLAALIGSLMGYTGRFAYDAGRPNGQPRRGLDVTRAYQRFGFVARTPLRVGLERTIAWWREQQTGLEQQTYRT
jgi:GDP-L-fucose synthase